MFLSKDRKASALCRLLNKNRQGSPLAAEEEEKMPSRASSERINFGKIKEVITPPNMIEVQVNSYKEFLQAEVAPRQRRRVERIEKLRDLLDLDLYDRPRAVVAHSPRPQRLDR